MSQLVFDAAVISVFMYGCEAWLSPASSKIGEKMYMAAIKCLLGVRATTTNTVCLVEIGLPSFAARVKRAQKKLMLKLLSANNSPDDDPFTYVWGLCSRARTRGYRYLTHVMEVDHIVGDLERLKNEILCSKRTKFITYRHLNPSLCKHSMYCNVNRPVPEHQRIAVTRFRVSSHNLAVESGRWSRIPRELRLCPCGSGVQDEEHVLCTCPLTKFIRVNNEFSFNSASQILEHEEHAQFVYQCLNVFGAV